MAWVLCFSLTWTDKQLAGIPRSKIVEQLTQVGFDENRQADVVGGLSGGWKMKLELARAMLYNADLLLLDEVRDLDVSYDSLPDIISCQPTNHVLRSNYLVDTKPNSHVISS